MKKQAGSSLNNEMKVLIAAGGTGGHIYPLEVAQYTVDFFKKYSLRLN